MARDQLADVVIVGGGIAGSALGTVLACRGIDVIVLERQTEYRDRVRGEYMHPWAVAEAQRLGLVDVFLDAGGVWLMRQIPNDEYLPSHVADEAAFEVPRFLPVPGALDVGHPAALSSPRRGRIHRRGALPPGSGPGSGDAWQVAGGCRRA